MRLVIVIGVIIVSILIVLHESRAHSPRITEPQTELPIPEFFNKTAEEGLMEALIYYDIQYPEIVYAQAILETGNFKSTNCLVHNNLFGLYNSKEKRYCRFNHWTESVVAYKGWIQYRYRPNEDYYHFLNRIGYAKDSLYINKVKRIVNSNDKRNSTGGGKGNS